MPRFLPACILFALVLVAFGPAVRNGFVDFDDPDYVTRNEQVQQGLSGEGLRWAFTTIHAGNWHPLTWISHMLDWTLYEHDAAGHHATSVLLHAVNTMLVFAFFSRIQGNTRSAFLVALLFGLHPLRVESVAWISERKDVLCAFFWMLSLLAYSRYAECERLRDKRRWKYYALTVCLVFLGLLAKGMIVTVPFLMLLLDCWPLDRYRTTGWKKLLLEKIPLFLLVGAVAFITWFAQKQAGAVAVETSLWFRVANALTSYLRYVGKLIVPIHLSPFYPRLNPEPWLPIASLLFLATITVYAIQNRTKRPSLLVGWLWFVGTLVPVIGIVQVGDQSMADRYSYIPCIGFWVAMV